MLRQIEKVAAEKRKRVREIETEKKNVNRDSRSFTLRSKSPSVGGIAVRVRKWLCFWALRVTGVSSVSFRSKF